MPAGIRVKGEEDVIRAFKQVRKDVLRELRPALRAAADVVRADAASRFSVYSPRSAAGYRVRVRLRGVAVEQSLRRTTGQHPFFGTLQMRTALEPALEAKRDEVIRTVELMVDTAGFRAGF